MFHKFYSWNKVDFLSSRLSKIATKKILMSSHNLIGRIRHIISSNKVEEGDGKKRARLCEQSNVSEEVTHLQGFIFECQCTDQSILSKFGRIFRLVVPLSLTREACHAATTGKLVEISRYSLICYRNGRGEVEFDSRDDWIHGDNAIHESSSNSVTVAEVHKDGLAIKEEDTAFTTSTISNDEQIEGPILTLEMLSAKEQVDSKRKKRKSLSKDPMNITAVVDAISPIITHDKERPFALIELYQPDTSPSYSVVAVLRDERALCMHAVLQPGRSITLVGVVSRGWKVPDAFHHSSANSSADNISEVFYKRLHQRTPDRVILIDDPSCIHFNVEDSHQKALTSTIESLTSIRGVIDSVYFYRYENVHGKADDIVHFVTLICGQQASHIDPNDTYDTEGIEIGLSPTFVRINVLKYSFSPHVMLGLQPGAILRAVNIHRITTRIENEEFYAACLRSTISIEQCATDNIKYSYGHWFIPSTPSFTMLPAHRIEKISTDSSKSIPSTRYFEEDCLQLKIQRLQLMKETTIMIRSIRILMDHHHKGETSYNSSVSRHPKSLTVRDPYTEFFDHAHTDGSRLGIECGSSITSDFSQFQCKKDTPSQNNPNVVNLDALRDICVQDFIKKMSNYCGEDNESRVSLGSTSSYNYYSSNAYVWGEVNFDKGSKLGKSSGCICNNSCRIPFSVPAGGYYIVPDNLKDHFLGWLQIKSAQVSCLCLGYLQCDEKASISACTDDLQHRFLRSSTLPEEIVGHNFIFIAGDLIFVGLIQFIAIPVACDVIFETKVNNWGGLNSVNRKCKIEQESTLSIHDCLKRPPNSDDDNSISIKGRLIRQRFQCWKAKRSQYYEGWRVTLSDINVSDYGSLSSSSFLQTIEVNISIPTGKPTSCSDFLWTSLKATLRDLLISYSNGSGKGNSNLDPLHKVSSEQLTMGLAFLHASECSSTQLILAGGWESVNNRLLSENDALSALQSNAVIVEIPLISREITKLGYQRFKCRLEDIKSFTTTETFNIPKPYCISQWLNFNVNTRKFLPGMLSKRLSRVARNNTQDRRKHKNPHSTLTVLDKDVPIISLVDLHYDACKVLNEKKPFDLHPSLLRRVHNAKILGINFCRARVSCTQCFEFLTASQSEERLLQCPSGCRYAHAAVKWECSAVIDDGTGQAKLYAEREAALLLLGSSLDVDSIEKGAWISENGVFFQPALPFSSHLQQCMKDASIEARKHNAQLMKENRCRDLKGRTATAYDFITALAKAEYLLQQHCRMWYQNHHHLKMDLFCRCKPLSVDITSVNRTEIQVAKAVDGYGLDFGTVHTSTLPPLKLILEDICLAYESSQNDTSVAWDMMRDFTSV